MTDVSITNQEEHTFTFADGEVQDIRTSINSNPDADPMPLSAPGLAIIFDFNGALKTITITGMLFDTTGDDRVTGSGAPTVQTLAQQRWWLETLVTGNQSVANFNSNYDDQTYAGGSITDYVAGSGPQTQVVVSGLTFGEVQGDPNKLPFTLKLIAGS